MRKIILTSLVLLAFLAVTGLKVNTAQSQAYDRYAKILASVLLEAVTAFDNNGADPEAIREYRLAHIDGLRNVDRTGHGTEISDLKTMYILFDEDNPDTVHVNYTSMFLMKEGAQKAEYAFLLNVSGYHGLQVGAIIVPALQSIGAYEVYPGHVDWRTGCHFGGGCVSGSKSEVPK